MEWVEKIAKLYACNSDRLKEKKDSEKFKKADRVLRLKLKDFKKCVDEKRKSKTLPEPCGKVLNSVDNHWPGLITFVEYSEISMDNNKAERELRGPVVGRKNYYGSGSVKMAQFAAMMFTIIHTLLANSINPRSWLTWFFNECSLKQGDVFAEIEKFLPWKFTEEQKENLKLHKQFKSPDTS